MGAKMSIHQIEKTAVFVFGVVFIIIILYMVSNNPTPTEAEFFVYRLVMALSAAGVGALLPGFLKLDISLSAQSGIRAGGALALFASVWFVNPADFGVKVIPPKEKAAIIIKQFLNQIDNGDYTAAYSLIAEKLSSQLSEDDFISMSQAVRAPLGNTRKRVLFSKDTPAQINGTPGPFVIETYQSRFENNFGVWVELVSTIPENGKWQILGYNIVQCIPPHCQALAALSQ